MQFGWKHRDNLKQSFLGQLRQWAFCRELILSGQILRLRLSNLFLKAKILFFEFAYKKTLFKFFLRRHIIGYMDWFLNGGVVETPNIIILPRPMHDSVHGCFF
jgi:hypothetical protein